VYLAQRLDEGETKTEFYGHCEVEGQGAFATRAVSPWPG